MDIKLASYTFWKNAVNDCANEQSLLSVNEITALLDGYTLSQLNRVIKSMTTATSKVFEMSIKDTKEYLDYGFHLKNPKSKMTPIFLIYTHALNLSKTRSLAALYSKEHNKLRPSKTVAGWKRKLEHGSYETNGFEERLRQIRIIDVICSFRALRKAVSEITPTLASNQLPSWTSTIIKTFKDFLSDSAISLKDEPMMAIIACDTLEELKSLPDDLKLECVDVYNSSVRNFAYNEYLKTVDSLILTV